MRLRSAFVAAALGAASTGCSTFWTDTLRNVVEAPIQGADDCLTVRRNERLADEAWRQVVKSNPEVKFSPDRGDGFKTGFADYLYVGGNGQPPAVPPFRYRLERYQTAQGHVAIMEWYDGYREGSAAARASGLREVIVLPLAAPPINALPERTGAGPMPQREVPTEPNPELPPPRTVPPVEAAPP
jgi:hypothetical protein